MVACFLLRFTTLKGAAAVAADVAAVDIGAAGICDGAGFCDGSGGLSNGTRLARIWFDGTRVDRTWLRIWLRTIAIDSCALNGVRGTIVSSGIGRSASGSPSLCTCESIFAQVCHLLVLTLSGEVRLAVQDRPVIVIGRGAAKTWVKFTAMGSDIVP